VKEATIVTGKDQTPLRKLLKISPIYCLSFTHNAFHPCHELATTSYHPSILLESLCHFHFFGSLDSLVSFWTLSRQSVDTSSKILKFSLIPLCLIRFWAKWRVHHRWCTGAWFGITSQTAFKIPSCLSEMTQISRPGLTATFRTRRRNQSQLPLFSFSTMANVRGTNWQSPSIPIAMRNVHSYFSIKNVPSIDKTSQ
jgi:hypothetical protein